MKKIFFKLYLVLSVALLFTSCKPEVKETGLPSPLISIEDVRLKYNGSGLQLKKADLLGATHICGVVISDPLNGNMPDGLVIVQNYKRKRLRGIALNLGNAASQYYAGDSVVVKIDGGTLDRVDGILQISGISEEAVTKIATGKEQKINVTTGTFTEVTGKMNIYESTLVQLRSAVAPEENAGKPFLGTVALSDWANIILMETKPSASFAANLVPGLGDYKGIALLNVQNQSTIWLRSSNDYQGQALEPYKPGELYANFPESWESIIGVRKGAYTAGVGETYPTGEWLMTRCYTLNSANVINKTGTWSLMMQNNQTGVVEMNFNLPYGVSKLSFDYGAAVPGTDTKLPINVKVEYSQDSGNTWKQLEGLLVVSTPSTKYTKAYTLDIKGPVRFRISKDNADARLFVDQIAAYQN